MRSLPLIALLCLALTAALSFAQEGKKGAKHKRVATPAAQEGAAKAEPAEWKGEPYTLTTCAASGRDINVKGTPQTAYFEGRELKFCCGGCAAFVKKDPTKFLEKVDAQLIAQQAPIYPTTKCIVAGTEMIKKGKDTAKEVMVGNRLFRVCCGKCAAKVKADPAAYAAKLDALVLDQMAPAYPIDTCVVNPKKAIDAKSKAFVVAGRPVKTCCAGCMKKVKADPMKYLPTIDAAMAEARAKEAAKKAKGKGLKKLGDQPKTKTGGKG